MSGGSYCYISSRLDDECVGRMYDIELNDLVKDLCDVLHDLEWWQSGDIGEKDYRDTVRKFKEKWFNENRDERLKNYIDSRIDEVKSELYELIEIEIEEAKE